MNEEDYGIRGDFHVLSYNNNNMKQVNETMTQIIFLFSPHPFRALVRH